MTAEPDCIPPSVYTLFYIIFIVVSQNLVQGVAPVCVEIRVGHALTKAVVPTDPRIGTRSRGSLDKDSILHREGV